MQTDRLKSIGCYQKIILGTGKIITTYIQTVFMNYDIWTLGETANSIEPPQRKCGDSTNLCNDKTCFSCNSIREANSQIVRGTLLVMVTLTNVKLTALALYFLITFTNVLSYTDTVSNSSKGKFSAEWNLLSS